jgi:uncharacterized BrkB/YihY/UPF0761 family membrane protein
VTGRDPSLSRSDEIRELGKRAAVIARERVPGGRPVFEALEREAASGGDLLSGGVAYRLFFWLVAFGLLLAAIASFWVTSDESSAQHAATSFGLAGASAHSALGAIQRGSRARWYFAGAGAALVLYFGISAERAVNVAYRLAWAQGAGRRASPLVRSAVFAGFAISGFALSVGTRWLTRHGGDGRLPFGLLVSLTVEIALVAWVMTLMPHADATYRALLPGAAVFSVGLALMQVLVELYLAPKLSRSPSLYGALGGATVVMLWLYLIARLLVLSAFLNATLWDRRHRTGAPPPEGEVASPSPAGR